MRPVGYGFEQVPINEYMKNYTQVNSSPVLLMNVWMEKYAELLQEMDPEPLSEWEALRKYIRYHYKNLYNWRTFLEPSGREIFISSNYTKFIIEGLVGTEKKLSHEHFTRTLGSGIKSVTGHYRLIDDEWTLCEVTKKVKSTFIPKDELPVESNGKMLTYDIETYLEPTGVKGVGNWIPYAIAIYDGVNIKTFYIGDFKNHHDMMDAAVKYMIDTYPDYVAYAHNGSRFDTFFILDSIARLSEKVQLVYHHNAIVGITHKLPGNKTGIRFMDSIRMFDAPLRKLCKTFKVEDPKIYFPMKFANEILPKGIYDYIGEIPDYNTYWVGNLIAANDAKLDYWKSEATTTGNSWSFREALERYISCDVKSLWQVMMTARTHILDKYKLDIFNHLTAPSLSNKLYRARYMPKDSIPKLTGIMDQITRESYYGGIVDVFKPYIHNGVYSDANGLYATAMSQYPMPIGELRWTLNPDINNPETFGIVQATVHIKEDLYYPILPIKLNGRLIRPVGSFTGWWTTELLRQAIRHNQLYSYTCHLGILCDKSYNLFKDYILHNYNLRLKAKAEGDSVMDQFTKLLNNTAYGYFGMHETSQETAVITQSEFELLATQTHIIQSDTLPCGKELVTFDRKTRKIISELPEFKDVYEDLESVSLHSYFNDSSLNINAMIAGYITSSAQIHMNEVALTQIQKGNFPAYTDTDSLVTPYDLGNLYGKDLGQFKEEHKLSEGIFAGLKLYTFKSMTEKSEVTRNKGLKERLNREEFANLYNSNTITRATVKWHRNLFKQLMTIKPTDLAFTRSIVKRVPILDTDGNWVDTKPLTLHNGVLVTKEYPPVPFNIHNIPFELIDIKYGGNSTLKALHKGEITLLGSL